MARVEWLEPGEEPMATVGVGVGSGMGKQLVILAALGLFTLLAVWMMFGGGDEAEASEPVGLKTEQAIDIERLPTFTPTAETVTNLSPEQQAATATMQAAISRPARLNNPAAAPSYIGVITYEDGCMISNIGFTTSGYSGQPFYLYVDGMLEQVPLLQIVQVSGFVQEFPAQCRYPVIFVSEIKFFDLAGTPAPISMAAALTDTITSTTVISGATVWGLQSTPVPAVEPGQAMADRGGFKPTATAAVTATAVLTMSTATPYPTYTPYPTTRPWIPPQRNLSDGGDDNDDDDPPTSTPTPTMTPSPVPANISGPVVAVSGCPATNLGVETGPNEVILLRLQASVQLPAGRVTDYQAMAMGTLTTVCGDQAISANLVSWYQPEPTAEPTATEPPTATATNTPTATSSPTPTATQTATNTPTATAEPIIDPTQEPTVEPTAEPTAEPTTEPTSQPTQEPTAEPMSDQQ